jgi:hypothetical protein
VYVTSFRLLVKGVCLMGGLARATRVCKKRICSSPAFWHTMLEIRCTATSVYVLGIPRSVSSCLQLLRLPHRCSTHVIFDNASRFCSISPQPSTLPSTSPYHSGWFASLTFLYILMLQIYNKFTSRFMLVRPIIVHIGFFLEVI